MHSLLKTAGRASQAVRGCCTLPSWCIHTLARRRYGQTCGNAHTHLAPVEVDVHLVELEVQGGLLRLPSVHDAADVEVKWPDGALERQSLRAHSALHFDDTHCSSRYRYKVDAPGHGCLPAVGVVWHGCHVRHKRVGAADEAGYRRTGIAAPTSPGCCRITDEFDLLTGSYYHAASHPAYPDPPWCSHPTRSPPAHVRAAAFLRGLLGL